MESIMGAVRSAVLEKCLKFTAIQQQQQQHHRGVCARMAAAPHFLLIVEYGCTRTAAV